MNPLTTARLHLTPPQPTDEPDYSRLLTDPAVGAWLGGTRTPEQARARLEAFNTQWQTHGYGSYTLREKAGDAFVGYCGLKNTHVLGRDEVELLYAVLPEFWSNGYTSEAAAAVVSAAFDIARLPELVCFTMNTNIASQRVMQKAGFKYEQDFIRADLPHVFYRLKASAGTHTP